MSAWKDPEKELPETPKRVLCIVDWMWVSACTSKSEITRNLYTIGMYDSSTGWEMDDAEIKAFIVKAWMPLPEYRGNNGQKG